MKEQCITLSQGSGGVESNALIEGVIYKIQGTYHLTQIAMW